ncbi:hypothetical protein Leryth_025553 [Lithospermum erythrorhizon]|nr:hypothetical protein Leryth_025553 [Lithospermum erythrorhizon]
MQQLQQIKIEKSRIDEERKLEKQELNLLLKEKVDYEMHISSLKRELEFTIKTHEENFLQLKTLSTETKVELEKKIIELACNLVDSQKRVEELENLSESKYMRWKKKELGYKHFIDSHVGSIQVAFLQDTISKKDEEIGQLRKQQTNSKVEKRTMKSSQSGSASLRRTSSQKTFNAMKKTVSNFDDGSEFNDKYFESNYQLSTKDFKHPNELFQQSRPSEELESWSIVADEGVTVKEVNLLGSGDSESGDKLSDMSDGVMSMATETDGSISIVDEYSLFLETAKPPPESAEKHNIPAKLPRPPQKHVQSGFSRLALNNISSKVSMLSGSKKSKGGSSSAVASSKRWQ